MASDCLSPNWLELPRDVTAAILQKLGAIEILKNAQRVCTQWRSICKEDTSMWSTIDMGNIGYIHTPQQHKDLKNMCRQAVDRSCGGLIELNIRRFCTDELLDYVTQRCTQIRCLRLVVCFCYVTDEGLCEAAKRLPMLEDLEISYCDVTANALQKFGERCPHMKTLKINRQGHKDHHMIYDDEAMAIANTMPELRRLQLFGNGLTNSGLEAILEGCPHLESLDLRQCFNIVDLKSSSSLGKRCDERIKDLRGPNDSTHDYGFSDVLYEYGSVYFNDGFYKYMESYKKNHKKDVEKASGYYDIDASYNDLLWGMQEQP